VILTELTHHTVTVLLVIMKILTVLVKIVPTNVSPVTLGLIVPFVKIQTEEWLVNVTVLTDSMMLVSLIVTLAQSNVELVL
jgi:uncharacterized membrane protein YjgN (DUF898 family)